MLAAWDLQPQALVGSLYFLILSIMPMNILLR